MERLWNRNYCKVMTANFLLFFAFYTLTPLLPLYLSEHFGATKDMIGLVLSGYTITTLLFRPFSGYMVDSFPRRTVLMACFGTYAVFFTGYLAASSLLLFTIVRTLHGGPFGGLTGANSTAAIDVLPSSRRTEGIAYYGLSNNLAMAIAPTIGIWIYQLTRSFEFLFWLALVVACAGWLVDATVRFPEREIVRNKSKLSLDRFFLVRGWLLGLNVVAFGFSFGVLSNYLAIYGKEVMGITGGTATYFLLCSIGLMVSRLQSGKALREGRLTRNAGGEKNELMLQHNPTFIGTSRFVSPAIDLTGKSNVVVSFKHYLDNYSGSHTLGIATTSDGGATWNDAWSETYNADGKYEVRQLVETSDIGQANVQFCIYYSGNCLNIDYWYFDDIVIYNLEDTDGDLDAIEVPDLVTVGYNAVSFRLINKGSNVITSLEASYQFEGHEVVTETFETNMEPLAAETFTFATPTFLEADNYLLTVNLLKVNGATDDDPENNDLSKTVSVNISLTERIPMIEHFSASTCGPCVNVNNLMLQFTQNNLGKFTYTKYPENFPGNGDPYYYPEVGVRDNYYNVPWVPYVLLDGVPQDGALTQDAFDAELDSPYVG